MCLSALCFLAIGGASGQVKSEAPAPPVVAPTPLPAWNWVWADKPGGAPETVFFRRRFTLPKNFVSVKLFISADDSFRAYFNEIKAPIAQGADYSAVFETDVTKAAFVGENLLAIECVNTGGPGGLLFKFVVKLPGNRTLVIGSNKETHYSQRVPPEWTAFKSDDSKWSPVVELAPAGGGVWGALQGVPQPDASRLVRLWERPDTVRVGDTPLSLIASNRMILSSIAASPSDMQMLAQSGFTLFQTDSDPLSTEETRLNRWDFSALGTPRISTKSLGLDWAYSPHFAFPPKWYRQMVPFTRLQCLEDKKPVEAFSIWDPNWAGFIERGYAALAREFTSVKPATANPASKLASPSLFLVGIHGDFGDAGLMSGAKIYDATQKEAWNQRFGNLHDHIGWWCDDPLARADFKAAMLIKYGSIATINSAWKRDFKKLEEIDFPPAPRSEARREWLDFTDWYLNSVGAAIGTNLASARKIFPKMPLLVSAGFGDENPRSGADNSLIPKIAAKYNAGVRSKHGGLKPFPDNAATMFGRIGSACRFYDVPFWSEPSTGMTAAQSVERIFEAASQGARGFFDWQNAAVANRDIYFRYGKFLTTEKPIVDVAMFYPAESQRLKPNEGFAPLFAQAGAYVREVANFDVVDDRMVNDGCLSNYRVVVLMGGMMADQPTLDKIKTWVDEGGVLLAYDFGKVSNFEGETPWNAGNGDLFGYIQQLAPAALKQRYLGILPSQYRLDFADSGSPNISDYLEDGWYAPEVVNNVPRRWTRANASLLLPVKPDTEYTLVIRTLLPPEATGKRRKVSINGQVIGEIGSTGDITYRFLISDNLIGNAQFATLSFDSETFTVGANPRPLGVQVQSIQLVEKGELEDGNAAPPPGTVRRELDLGKLETQWAQRFGKGLTIYFPANRKLLKGYVEVIRQAVYHLGAIDPGRKDALPADNAFDGLYATLFRDKILYYNSKDVAVTKTVKITPEQFANWKDQVRVPDVNAWTITVPAHGMEAIWFTSEPQELLFECEEFRQLNGFKPTKMPDCSPGVGLSGVNLPKGGSISTRFIVEVPGRYSIFSHCLRNSRLEIGDVLVDDAPISIQNLRTGRSVLNGNVLLAAGKHTLTLRARPDREMRADYVLLTNDTSIKGYDFAYRRTPIE